MMKKFVLSLLCVLTAVAVYAQKPSVTPPEGSFNVTGDVQYKGLSSVTINVDGAEINRDCAGYISLNKDGVRMVDIPASNEYRVYLESGAGVEGGSDAGGAIRIDFWKGGLSDSPYAYQGTYRMVVPAGLYTVAGEPNKAFFMEWTILDNPKTAKIVSVPANGASVETLSEFTLTFEGATDIKLASASKVYVPDPYYDSGAFEEGEGEAVDIVPTISVSGNKATLTFAEPFEQACNVSLYIEDGAFKDGDLAITGTVVNVAVLGKSEIKPNEDGMVWLPAPGTFEGGLPSIDVTSEWASTVPSAYCNVKLQLPEGAQIKSVIGLMMSNKAYLADANKEKVTAYTVKYSKNKTNDGFFFGNNAYVGTAGAYTMDIPWSLPVGTYYVMVPAGAFTYTLPDNPDVAINCPALEFGPYTITAAEVKYDVLPEVGSTLEELPDVVINFEGTEVSLESIYNRHATINAGTVVYDVDLSENAIVGNTLTVKGGLNAPGEYTIEIPGLMVDGQLVNVEPLKYTVERSNIDGITVISNGELIPAKFVDNDDSYGWNANVVIPSGKEMAVAIELPVGFDSVYYRNNNSGIAPEEPGVGDDDITALSMIPAEDLEGAGFQLAADNKIPVAYGANDFSVAFGANGSLTEPAPLMLQVYAPLPIREKNPAEVVPSYPDVTVAYVGFATGGDNGIALDYNEGAVVKVTKDGADFASYPVVKDSPNVYSDRNYNERLMINFGKALEPGVYSVRIPSGFISGKIAGDSSIEGSEGLNEYIDYTFTVAKAFPYEVAPAQGKEVVAADLATVTITYPAGTTVTLKEFAEDEEAVKPTLEFVDPSYTDAAGNPSEQHTVLTAYDVTAEGNVVTLTAVDPEGITAFTDAMDRKWDIINVPAGLWTVTDGTDDVENANLELGHFAVRSFAPSMFTFEPALDTKGLKMADLKEITLVLPDGVETNPQKTTVFKAGGATAVFTLYPLPKSTTFSFTYTCKEISEDGKRITVVMKANSGPTSLANNVDVCQVGPTQIEFAKELFVKGEEKNAAMVVPAYNVDGVEYVPIYNSSPANYGVVEAGIASLSLNLLRASYVCDPEAEITLSKNGEVIASVKAGETTTAAAKDSSKAGSTTIAFSNLFKKADNTNWTEPGKYVFTVPAGAFQQKDSEFKNIEKVVEVFVPQAYDNYTVSPAPATFEGTTEATLVCTPNHNELEYTAIEITYPEAKNIQLNPDYKNILKNGYVGTATAANIAKGALAVSSVTGMSFDDAEVVGNTVRLILSQPYRKSTAVNKYPAFKIPAGAYLVDVEQDGVVETIPNAMFTLWYQPLDIYPLEAIEPTFDKTLAAEDLASLTMYASESMYNQAQAAPVLKNEEGVVVANYKGAAPAEGKSINYIVFNFVEPADDADANLVKSLSELPEGKYTFVIPEGALTGGSASSATMITHNVAEMTYEINVASLNLNECMTLVYPEKPVFDSNENPYGLSQVAWSIAKPGVQVNPNVKEPITITVDGEMFMQLPLVDAEPMFEEVVQFVPGDGGAEYPSIALMLGYLPDYGEMMPYIFGQYDITFPAGAFIYNGVESNEFTSTLVYSQGEQKEVDMTYTLNPEPLDGAVEGFNDITLEFVYADAVDYAGQVATLTLPNGDVLKANFPDLRGNKLVFHFNDYENGSWPAGEYTFTVNPGKVYVDINMDMVDEGNFSGLTVKYTVIGGEEMPALIDHIKLSTPSAFECDRTTASSMLGKGMMMVSLGVDSKDIAVNEACESTVDMYFNGTLLKSIPTYVTEDNTGMVLMSVGAMEDGDELLDFPAVNEIYMIFTNIPEDATFSQTGEYRVVIPDGAILLGDKEMKGLELVYNYKDEENIDFTYVLDPDPENALTGEPKALFSEIKLTFPNASYLSYDSKASLTGPDGTVIYAQYPGTNFKNTITYKFGNAKTDWTQYGAGIYTFVIPANSLYVDDAAAESMGNPGNWPSEKLTFLYNVENVGPTGIALVGVDAADSYNVYTMDGKVVKLNAAPAEMFDLEPGLYIINGKKAYIRK